MDLTEPLDLAKGLEARGASFIIESAGNPSLTLSLVQAFKNVPETSYLHFYFQKQLKSVLKPSTVVIGSNNSIYRNGKNTFRGVRREEASLTYWGNTWWPLAGSPSPSRCSPRSSSRGRRARSSGAPCATIASSS
jgi:hypothetical protein